MAKNMESLTSGGFYEITMVPPSSSHSALELSYIAKKNCSLVQNFDTDFGKKSGMRSCEHAYSYGIYIYFSIVYNAGSYASLACSSCDLI